MIALLVGATIGTYILRALWEFVVFKRVMDDPLKGKIGSSVAAYLSASVLYGFGAADVDTGAFETSGFLIYLLPALIVGALAYRRGLTLRHGSESSVELEKTFG